MTTNAYFNSNAYQNGYSNNNNNYYASNSAFGTTQPFQFSQQVYTPNTFMTNLPNPSWDYNNNFLTTNPNFYRDNNLYNENDKNRYLKFYLI